MFRISFGIIILLGSTSVVFGSRWFQDAFGWPLRRTSPSWIQRAQSLDSVKLSWMIVSRNDSYYESANTSISSLQRLNASLFALFSGLQTYRLGDVSEVIIVDYGSVSPLRTEKTLLDLVTNTFPRCKQLGTELDSSCRAFDVRVIHVPPWLAVKYHVTPTGVSEVHGYNAGARRAKGSMLFRLDRDTITAAPFFKFLASQRRRDWPALSRVWVSGRRDSTIEQGLELLRNPLQCFQDVTKYAKWHNQDFDVAKWMGAIGIFAVPKVSWYAAGGYNEKYTEWGHMEVEFGRRLNVFGTPLDLGEVLRPNSPFVHIWHEHGRPKNRMFMTFNNTISWGMVGEDLEETIL